MNTVIANNADKKGWSEEFIISCDKVDGYNSVSSSKNFNTFLKVTQTP